MLCVCIVSKFPYCQILKLIWNLDICAYCCTALQVVLRISQVHINYVCLSILIETIVEFLPYLSPMYLKYMLIEASQSVLIQAGESVAVVVLCQSKQARSSCPSYSQIG